MTLIDTNSDFWTEAFELEFLAVAAGGTAVGTVTLTRAGRYVGAAGSVNIGSIGANIGAVNIHRTSISPLAYGDAISAARVAVRNNEAVPQDISIHVIIFMRK